MVKRVFHPGDVDMAVAVLGGGLSHGEAAYRYRMTESEVRLVTDCFADRVDDVTGA